jgi:hypothetical protein
MNRQGFNKAIAINFYIMAEGVEYVLNSHAFKNLVITRTAAGGYGTNPSKDQYQYRFKRSDNVLFVSYDNGKSYEPTVCCALDSDTFAFALAGALTTAYALAFALGELEPLQVDACAGKVVEIEGRKYTLQPVKS